MSPAGVKERLRRVRGLGTALDVQDRVSEIGGGLLASAVTLALFLSLFPLLLVGLSVMGFIASGDDSLASDLIAELGLTGDTARYLTDALEAAEDSRSTTSVLGFAGLVWAALGVVGSVQAVNNRAWQLPGRGLKARLWALIWLLGAIVLLGGAVGLAGLLSALPGWLAPLQVAGGIACAIGFFLWTFRILLGRSLPLRVHLPGAVVGGIGFHALTIVAAVVVPRQAASSSALYGSIGVVLALLGWLLLFGRLLVYSVVLNVIRYERRHGTVHVEVEAPRFAGDVPLAASRGAVIEHRSHEAV